jgi:NAD(P)-dependent dehydrogenase (short-subunit alcohol dehydrogenase family)
MTQRDDELAGKIVVVTGGSKGLGLLVAREFGRRGASVTICSRNLEELQGAQDWLRDHDVSVDFQVCDIGKKDEAEAFIRGVEAKWGRIDYLVNNAGVIEVGPLDTATLEDFEMAVDVMLWGVVVPSLAALPGMKERKSGRIVNITSLGGKISVPHLLPYSTAKFAAIGFSEGLRAELAGTGVGVVTVVPGLMRTGSFVNALFRGNRRSEFTWFSVLSSLPLLTNDAEKAAQRITKAAVNNEPELILSLAANAAVRAQGVAPGLLSYALSLTARGLPSSPQTTPTPATAGRDLDDDHGSIADRLRSLGNTAKRRFQPPLGHA